MNKKIYLLTLLAVTLSTIKSSEDGGSPDIRSTTPHKRFAYTAEKAQAEAIEKAKECKGWLGSPSTTTMQNITAQAMAASSIGINFNPKQCQEEVNDLFRKAEEKSTSSLDIIFSEENLHNVTPISSNADLTHEAKKESTSSLDIIFSKEKHNVTPISSDADLTHEAKKGREKESDKDPKDPFAIDQSKRSTTSSQENHSQSKLKKFKKVASRIVFCKSRKSKEKTTAYKDNTQKRRVVAVENPMYDDPGALDLDE